MSDISKSTTIKNPISVVYPTRENKKERVYANEPHIAEKNPLTGIKTEAHKISNALLTYFPKGFSGSRNSDFYEYLSLGKIPYIIGSIMLYSLYKGASKQYNSQSFQAANSIKKQMGAGVVFYGVGKWLLKKFAHTGIKASTGVDLDLKYKNIVKELPENGKQAGFERIQYPGVFDSADFPRKDLIAADSQLNTGSIYAYEDKIAKKAGFKERLNAPNQTIWPKIRELKVRTTALENISQYVIAATGVALGSQDAITNINLADSGLSKEKISQTISRMKGNFLEKIKPSNIIDSIKELPGKISTGFSNFKKEVALAKTNYVPSDIVKEEFSNIKNYKGIKNKLSFIGNQIKTQKQILAEKFNGTTLGMAKNVLSGKVKTNGGVIGNVFRAVKKAFSELWQGSDRNVITKNYGKVLILGSAVSALLTWLIPAIAFKKNPDTMKSKVDNKKEYEVV